MMTLPGIPFIYQGQEVGYPVKINLFEKFKIDWSANPDLQKWYGEMLNYYETSTVLKRGIVAQFDGENKKVLIYQRQLLGAHSLWVIVNTSNADVTATLPVALQAKKMQDVITHEGMVTEKEIKLRPFEYHMMRVE